MQQTKRMKVIRGRVDVKLISAVALAQYMTYRGASVRGLAERVPCSRSTIGHLRSGRRAYVRPAWALAIEDALDAPRGTLFTPVVTPALPARTRRAEVA